MSAVISSRTGLCDLGKPSGEAVRKTELAEWAESAGTPDILLGISATLEGSWRTFLAWRTSSHMVCVASGREISGTQESLGSNLAFGEIGRRRCGVVWVVHNRKPVAIRFLVCWCCFCCVGSACPACVALRCSALPCVRFVCSGRDDVTM